jgi:rhodanese-related sulfurtransferase
VWPFRRGAGAAAAPAHVATVDVKEAFSRQKRGAKLVDVRSAAEFRGSHPKGARNVPPAAIKRDESGLGRSDEVLVICQSGHRSPRQAKRLAGMGFTNVSNVNGGLVAWKKAGLPLKE